MKCAICSKEIETIYLDKPLGTYIKNADGKRIIICNDCQKEHGNDKQKMLDALEK